MARRIRKDQVYFVAHLDAQAEKPSPDAKFEIQILDRNGGGELCAYVSEAERALSHLIAYTKNGPVRRDHNRAAIPQAVIDAALRQPQGKGDYVNCEGESVKQF